MSDTPNLDPDEVTCPRCGAAPGDVCRTPTGRRAKRIHDDRRTATRGTHEATRAPKGPPATDETRRKGASAGGRATARKRAARREQIEQTREELEAEALAAEAAKLAEDAARWMRDEQNLRRRVLDVAGTAWARAGQALEDLREVVLDDNGRPQYVPNESPDGPPLRLETRGAWSTRDAKDLMTTAAIALDKVLKLEGAADATIRHTGGIEVTRNGPDPDLLDDDALRGLLERARDVVDRETRLDP